jgi:tetratricopeptide (TPR) repeat protein
MPNRAVSAGAALARVLAHCGGSPEAALGHLAGAIASAPHEPEPYTTLAELWEDQRSELARVVRDARSLSLVLARSYIRFLDGDMDEAAVAIGAVTGAKPEVAWATAPWFGDERFLGAVSAGALAEAAMRTMDSGRPLDTDAMRERFRPWFHAIDVVAARSPEPEALARMAILLRTCGLIDGSFALCDKADSVQRIMLTEVVRAGTWRKAGDPARSAAAFERALALDPTNWSLYLDLADLRAEQDDFADAVRLVGLGLRHEPDELFLRAAGAAYRARLNGSPADLGELIELASRAGGDSYFHMLIDQACLGPGLPAELVAAARRVQQGE